MVQPLRALEAGIIHASLAITPFPGLVITSRVSAKALPTLSETSQDRTYVPGLARETSGSSEPHGTAGGLVEIK